MERSKGISPLIAAVLLIAFTIAVAGLAGPFLTEVTQDAQTGTDEDLDTVTSASDARLEIMDSEFKTGVGNYSITVRNSGTDTLENFTLTVQGDSPAQKQIDQKLKPGDVKSLTIQTTNSKVGDKITFESRNLAVKTDTENIDEIKPKTVDDFEDGDLSEYSDNSVFEISNSQTIQGEYSLHAKNAQTIQSIAGHSGLERNITKPAKFDFYWRQVGSTGKHHRHIFMFAVDEGTTSISNADGYGVSLYHNDNIVGLRRWDGGSGTDLDVDGTDLPSDTWLRIRVKWDDGTLGGNDGDITAKIYNTQGTRALSDDTLISGAEYSANDNTYPTNSDDFNGILFMNNGNDYYDKPGEFYADLVVLR